MATWVDNHSVEGFIHREGPSDTQAYKTQQFWWGAERREQTVLVTTEIRWQSKAGCQWESEGARERMQNRNYYGMPSEPISSFTSLRRILSHLCWITTHNRKNALCPSWDKADYFVSVDMNNTKWQWNSRVRKYWVSKNVMQSIKIHQ